MAAISQRGRRFSTGISCASKDSCRSAKMEQGNTLATGEVRNMSRSCAVGHGDCVGTWVRGSSAVRKAWAVGRRVGGRGSCCFTILFVHCEPPSRSIRTSGRL